MIYFYLFFLKNNNSAIRLIQGIVTAHSCTCILRNGPKQIPASLFFTGDVLLPFSSSDFGFFSSSLLFFHQSFWVSSNSFMYCWSCKFATPFRLDVGDGKEVEVEECPRSKLQENSIKYLGPVCNFLIISIIIACIIIIFLKKILTFCH